MDRIDWDELDRIADLAEKQAEVRNNNNNNASNIMAVKLPVQPIPQNQYNNFQQKQNPSIILNGNNNKFNSTINRNIKNNNNNNSWNASPASAQQLNQLTKNVGSQLNFNKNITKELPEKQTSLSNFGFTQQKSQLQPQQQQKIFPIIQNFENNKTQNKIIPQQPTITKVDIVNHKNSSNVSSNVSSLSKINQSNNEIFIDDPVDEKEKEQDYMNNIVYLPTISNIKGKEVNRSFRVSLQPDYQNCETFIYPHVDEYPVRKYQRTIIERSFHYNTLVVLPTGLGKTFIAAVVMKNYLRWFPQGKIIFLAPTSVK